MMMMMLRTTTRYIHLNSRYINDDTFACRLKMRMFNMFNTEIIFVPFNLQYLLKKDAKHKVEEGI